MVGYGDIGQACARLARAFKMKVVALRRNTQLSAAEQAEGVVVSMVCGEGREGRVGVVPAGCLRDGVVYAVVVAVPLPSPHTNALTKCFLLLCFGCIFHMCVCACANRVYCRTSCTPQLS